MTRETLLSSPKVDQESIVGLFVMKLHKDKQVVLFAGWWKMDAGRRMEGAGLLSFFLFLVSVAFREIRV